MSALAVALASLVGVSLGLLGGGGSVLMVPVLVYVAGMSAAQSASTSLLVVGAGSALALIPHAVAGRVRWKIGAYFGLASMGGAYLGGRLSVLFPERLLLSMFALLMIVTAMKMLRPSALRCEPGPEQPAATPSLRTLAVGAAVGLLAGLVGAGGGFVIVPALVLYAGLPMAAAAATSLLVIALQSATGLLGHLGQTEIEWGLAGALTLSALAGSLVGALVSSRLNPRKLRSAFGWLVLALGVVMAGEQLMFGLGYVRALSLPTSWSQAVLGGLLIGAAGSVLWLFNGRVSGISGIAAGLTIGSREDRSWRATFVAGLLVGGLWMAWLHPASFRASDLSLPYLLLAGALVGVGTSLANGCTSGHGVCGISRLSARSLVATATFMLAGAASVFLVRHLLQVGGPS